MAFSVPRARGDPRPYDVWMKLWNRLGEWRRHKAHERYLRERDRQRQLERQDAQDAVRRVAQQSGTAQQGMYHGGP